MDDDEELEKTCRICLETSELYNISTASSSVSNKLPLPSQEEEEEEDLEEDRLISPCACTGTQAYVHFKCLRKWQNAVLATRKPGSAQSPALVCSVCTQKFSVSPPRPPFMLRLWEILMVYACEVAGIFMILCACYLAIAGHSLQSLLEDLEDGVALAKEIIPCSFSVNVIEEKCTSAMCNRFFTGKVGVGRLNLHPGTLLVATPAMPSPYFFGSVVLLYEHRRCSGSRGLILNMQPEGKKVMEWENRVLPSVTTGPSILRHVAHGMGGPIAKDEWAILNRCPCCAPSLAGKKPACGSRPPPKDWWGQELLPGVFLGREFGPAAIMHQGPNIVSHQVLHGHAEWILGQLASEIRRGLWITKQNASEVLLATPPEELWHVIIRE